ncbi:hypothetical protein SHLI107390_18395 [Shewanella livingstonensis]
MLLTKMNTQSLVKVSFWVAFLWRTKYMTWFNLLMDYIQMKLSLSLIANMCGIYRQTFDSRCC